MDIHAQLVAAEELIDQTDRADRLFIDVRLGEHDEEIDKFRKCHIHGAVYAQIRDMFAAPPTRASGNLPLPDVEHLSDWLNGLNVGQETEIVVYGPTPALAARGWWVLNWAGAPHVRLLDGGLRAWTMAGGAVAKGDPAPRPPRRSPPLKLCPAQLPEITVRDVENLPPESVLIDARDEASYLSGHIPGAYNLPASDLWTPRQQIRPVADLSEIYRPLGLTAQDDVVVYCGGGVLSALHVLTLSALGIVPRLYVGSWSEWSRNAERMARSVSSLPHTQLSSGGGQK